MEPIKKDLTMITLAQKGGDDADLLLLDEMHSIKDFLEGSLEDVITKIDDLKSSIPQLADVFKEIGIIQGKPGQDGARGEKGDKGDKGDQGSDGQNGRDGVDGTDGADGEDGLDGASGENADEKKLLDEIASFRAELEQKFADFDKKIKEIPEKAGGLTVFGSGKTRFVKYDLSDQLNGVTKTFTIGTHFGIHSVQSSSAPFGAWREGTDYNEVGKTIVFTAAVDPAVYLATGQSLIVKVLR